MTPYGHQSVSVPLTVLKFLPVAFLMQQFAAHSLYFTRRIVYIDLTDKAKKERRLINLSNIN